MAFHFLILSFIFASMRNIKYLIPALIALFFMSCSDHTSSSEQPLYKYKEADIDARADDLLARMTVEEKVAQLLGIWDVKKNIRDPQGLFFKDSLKSRLPHGIGQIARPNEDSAYWHYRTPENTAEYVNAMQKYLIEETRLGIPAIMHLECLHGIQSSVATSFPQPIGLGCTFNTDLVEDLYEMVAKEARSMGCHTALTPVLDVARDPRWGRVEETYGEDPYLNGTIGTACINGFQGTGENRFDSLHLGATVKHFAAHGEPTGGTNIAPENFSMRYLR